MSESIMSPTLWFVLLCGVAFLLFALEVFIPDLILAAVGAVCLLAACVVAFYAFPAATAGWISTGLVVGTLTGFVVWLIKMPDTRIGKSISLGSNLQNSHAASADAASVGARGVAETALMPGGFARIGGKRLDVVCVRGFIEAGSALEVVEVRGNHVVVKPVSGGAV